MNTLYTNQAATFRLATPLSESHSTFCVICNRLWLALAAMALALALALAFTTPVCAK